MTAKQSGWPRTSRHQRGYGAAWDKLRAQILKRDKHLCRCDECTRLGRIRAAGEVDHLVPKAKGGTDDPSNLRAINRDCHRAKTDAEIGRRRKHPVGADGLPTDPRHHWNRG